MPVIRSRDELRELEHACRRACLIVLWGDALCMALESFRCSSHTSVRLVYGGGGGSWQVPTRSSHTGGVSFKRTRVSCFTRQCRPVWISAGSSRNQYGKFQLPSFRYIFASRTRCCHLSSTSADLCKSNPELVPTQKRVRPTCI